MKSKKYFVFWRMGKIHKNVTNFLCGPIDKTGSRVYTVEN
ncbi:hypothetical protein [Oscillospiraceae bacterium]|nr:hypothetical protein [Oscillospiraceae bacterium]